MENLVESLSETKKWLKNKENWKKLIIPAILILGLYIAGRLVDLHQYLQTAQNWVWGLGPWGPFAFGVVYVIAMLLPLPGTPFTLIAALIFGTLWGYVTMLAATTTAAVIGFLIARYFAKGFVQERLRGQAGFDQVTRWVEQNLWLAIPFVRIMPIFPFALNNYALGLTNIPFWVFLLASEIIFIPMTAVLVLGASALYTAMIQGEVSWDLILGSLGTGIIVLVLGLYGKKKLMGDEPGDSDPQKEPAG